MVRGNTAFIVRPKVRLRNGEQKSILNVHLGGNHVFWSFLRISPQNDPSENHFQLEIEVRLQNPLYESTFERFVCVAPNHKKFF